MHSSLHTVLAIVAAVIVGTAVFSTEDSSAAELVEAPLEDVWPALSERRLGDLDAMVAHGEIRVLTTFTLGSYFIDRGTQRGTTYELSRILEKYIRDKLGKDGRRLKVTIVPVRRDQLLPHLIAGYGDVVF